MNHSPKPKKSSSTQAQRPSKPAADARDQPLLVSLPTIAKALGVTVADAEALHERLTERERQIAGLMADGRTNREIAEQIGISPKTLDIHRANLQRKLEARTTARVANVVNLLRLAEAAGNGGAASAPKRRGA